MKKKLILNSVVIDKDLERIKEYCDVDFMPWYNTDYKPGEDELINLCKGYEIVYVYMDQVTERVIKELKESGMKILGCGRGTPNNIDWKAAHKYEIPIMYAPGRNSHAVAEYTVGMMLAACKGIPRAYMDLQNGMFLEKEKDIYDVPNKKDVTWMYSDNKRENPRTYYPKQIDVYGRTIGLIGMGEIGSKVAVICNGLGMRVLGYDPYQPDKVFEETNTIRRNDYKEMLKESDFVSVHLSVNDATRGMINKEWFDSMKDGCYFINTARAAVVDQKSLIEAVESGKVSHAVLDVMWDEPAPKNHPFIHNDHVLLTPHRAGASEDIDKWSSKMIADEIIKYAKGEENTHIWKRLE